MRLFKRLISHQWTLPNHVTACLKNDLSAASGLIVSVNVLLADVFLIGTLHLLHGISTSILSAVLWYSGQGAWVALVLDKVEKVP